MKNLAFLAYNKIRPSSYGLNGNYEIGDAKDWYYSQNALVSLNSQESRKAVL
jgi:hypothetical protein